jgi:hemerythrin
MATFDWNNNYSVNIKEIDEQHKTWLKILNKLDEAIMLGESSNVLGRTVEDALEYTKSHFSMEETLMKNYGYPDFDFHKQKHDDLIIELNSLLERNEKNETGLAIDVMGTLGDWLIKHILEEDKKYSSYLNDKGVT